MSEVILGIDLGTTNSLVAICEKGKPFVLKPKDGSSLVSSIIHVEKDGKLTVGSQAKVFKVTDTARTASSIKRFMGKGKEDLKDFHGTVDISHSTDKNIIISLGEKDFTAVELSSEILKRLKKLAEDTLGHKVMKAVITVPAYFNDSQRTATKAAGLLAGLDVVRIVNEPTAAALAYGLDQKNQGTIAVYDLGGGTFDLSILKLNAGIFEVLSTNGDTALGGDDFDKVLFDIIVSKLKAEAKVKYPDPETDLNFKALLLDLAEKAKIVLSTDIETKVNITYQMSGVGHKTSVIITRSEFESKSEALVERTLTVTKRALEDAKLNPSQIDNIVMVGGSTRLPIVQRKVREFFGKELDLSMNPDEVVALGAAIQADILSGNNRNTVLLDIIPLSLGIETYGGTVGKILHRNTKIPSIARETFTTHVEGQTNVLIHVLQGERELAADCRSLAKFNLKGLPALPAGLPKIQVTFLIDANGILNVQAKELATGIETAIDVKPTYGLNDEQVEKMLSDSFEFAESDMKSRQLIDTRVQAQGVLRSAEKILNESESLRETDIHSEHMAALGLTEDDIKNIPKEIEAMNTQIYKVRNMVTGTDYIAIKNELEKLEEIAKPLAAKVMNAALRRSLQNKNVSEVITKK